MVITAGNTLLMAMTLTYKLAGEWSVARRTSHHAQGTGSGQEAGWTRADWFGWTGKVKGFREESWNKS